VILTTPLESLAVGNTILLSKGLVDTLPDENALAAVIAFQLAHIVTGHHIDTRYAFNDRLLFPDTATFRRITMNHSTPDNDEARRRQWTCSTTRFTTTRRAAWVSSSSSWKQGESAAVAVHAAAGDSLVRADGQPWLAGLTQEHRSWTWTT